MTKANGYAFKDQVHLCNILNLLLNRHLESAVIYSAHTDVLFLILIARNWSFSSLLYLEAFNAYMIYSVDDPSKSRLLLLRSRCRDFGFLDKELALDEFEEFVDETVGKALVTFSNQLRRRGEEMRGKKTYMTGALMTKTACHSFQFRGKIENSVCKIGV